MATIDESIYSLLSGIAGITALVSTRIYPAKMPQNPTYPAVVMHTIGEEEIERLMNQAAAGSRLMHGRWQIDAWAETEKAARAVGRAVFAGIDAYDAPAAAAGAVVRAEAIGGGECEYDHTVEKWFHSRDYRVWWRE